MKKLYICGPEGKGEGVYHLIADDGEHLASHLCSYAGFAEGDLHDNRPERKQEWQKRFGEYSILWIGDDEITASEMLKRNKTWGEKEENAKKQEENQPSVEIEVSNA